MPPGGVLFLLRGLRNSGFNHKHIIDCTVLCSNFCHSNIVASNVSTIASLFY